MIVKLSKADMIFAILLILTGMLLFGIIVSNLSDQSTVIFLLLWISLFACLIKMKEWELEEKGQFEVLGKRI